MRDGEHVVGGDWYVDGRWWWCCSTFLEWKAVFVKDDMAGCDDTSRGEVEAPVAAVIRWVAEEDTPAGARAQLVGRCGTEI